MKLQKLVLLFVTLSLISGPSSAAPKKEELAIKLKNMFIAGKVFIFKQQKIINSKTSSKVALSPKNFMKLIKREHKKLFKEEWPNEDHPYLAMMTKAMRTVMQKNYPLINDSSKAYKGFIAAVFAHQVATEFSKDNDNVSIKFTAPEDRIRNPQNASDDWEAQALKGFLSDSWPKNNSYSEQMNHKYRYIYPLYYEGVCLACHGNPKDNPLNADKEETEWSDIDVAGYKMEGWSEGDLAGGISIEIGEI